MARKKFVCGNWKMHKTAAEAVALVRELRQRLNTSAQVAIAPPLVITKAEVDEVLDVTAACLRVMSDEAG